MVAPRGPSEAKSHGCFFPKVGNYDMVVWLNVASLYKNFKLQMCLLLFACGGGGSSIIVLSSRGSGIFVHEKRGAQKCLCNINTCPAWPCCIIKSTDKNAISNDLETSYFQIFPLSANYGGALWAPQQNLSDVFFPNVGNYDRAVWLIVASLYKNFKFNTNVPFVICMGGGGLSIIVLSNKILASNFSFPPAPPPL